jgi:hypothetical protein
MKLGEFILENPGLVSFRKVSYFGLRPGDIIGFVYQDESRFGIIVSSQRTSSGLFLSTQLNTLLNIFLLESLSEDKFRVVINSLYKNRSRCSYWGSPTILGAIFGKENFRTFDVSKIKHLHEIKIKK